MRNPHRRLAVVAALAGAVWTATAEETKKPSSGLLESKEALRQLQKDQVLRKNADEAGGSLKDALPRLDTPMPGAPAVSYTPPAERAAAEAKRGVEKQDNWLLDGVERLRREEVKLGKEAKGQSRDSSDDEEKEAEKLEPGHAEAREKFKPGESIQADQSRKDALLTGVADPMAGLMKDWLAGSPVDQKVFDSIIGKSGGHAVATADSRGPAGPLLGPVGSRGGDSIVVPGISAPKGGPAANPFLQALEPLPDVPATTGAGATSQSIQPLRLQPPNPGLSGNGPAMPTRREERKPPPSAADENRKYFPQQKRF